MQRMLAQDEASSEDVPVRREDQAQINKFSRLHNRASTLEIELQKHKKEKEDLEEIASDIEMIELEGEESVRYKIGDSFFVISLERARELIESSSDKIQIKVDKLESALSTIHSDIEPLKVALYSRFGRSINLEI